MPEDGSRLATIVARIEREILADANRLAHPMYMGHQVSFPLPTAVWTEAVISALNQSVGRGGDVADAHVARASRHPLDVRRGGLPRGERRDTHVEAGPRRRSPRCSPRARPRCPTPG